MKKKRIRKSLFLLVIIIAVTFNISICVYGIGEKSIKPQISDYIKKLKIPETMEKGIDNASIEVIKWNKTFVCYVKGFEYNAVIVAINNSNKTQQYEVVIPDKYIGKNTSMIDLISLKRVEITGGKVTLYMEPFQACTFVLQYEALKLNVRIVYFAILGLLIITLGLVLLKRYASSKIN